MSEARDEFDDEPVHCLFPESLHHCEGSSPSWEEGMAGAGKGGILLSPASAADSQKARLRLLFIQSTELDN